MIPPRLPQTGMTWFSSLAFALSTPSFVQITQPCRGLRTNVTANTSNGTVTSTILQSGPMIKTHATNGALSRPAITRPYRTRRNAKGGSSFCRIRLDHDRRGARARGCCFAARRRGAHR
jgi:hypothetical protein